MIEDDAVVVEEGACREVLACKEIGEEVDARNALEDGVCARSWGRLLSFRRCGKLELAVIRRSAVGIAFALRYDRRVSKCVKNTLDGVDEPVCPACFVRLAP